MTIMPTETVLTMLQHADSQFPSGGFAFSAGLEGLLADGHFEESGLVTLFSAWLQQRWAKFDQVVVLRSASCRGDVEKLSRLDSLVEAMLLAPAERLGSQRAGAALLAAHTRLDTPGARDLDSAVRRGTMRGHRAVLEGVLWTGIGLQPPQIRLISAFNYVNALGSAAVRLGACGSMAQQRLLTNLTPLMARLLSEPISDAVEPSSFSPMSEIALMRLPSRHGALFAT